MNGGNAIIKAHVQIANLAIASITAVTTLLKSVAVAGANFAAGDIVLVSPQGTFTNGVAIYGSIIDATHVGINFVNASAGAIDPADTFTFDILVFSRHGNIVTGT